MLSIATANGIKEWQILVDDHIERWEILFQELIRIPSVFENEHAIVDKVSRQIEALGVPAKRIPHQPKILGSLAASQLPISEQPERASLVARLPGTGGGRSLIINTHLDIVPEGDPASWTHPPFGAYIDKEQNIIYGRGAMDDKAGVTASLAVLETLSKSQTRLSGDVVFHYVLEDEITGNGTLLCLEAGYGGDAALIMDGTRMEKAINQHAGQLQFEIEVRGKPASVSVSHMGINAAEMMARLVIQLRDAIFELNEQRLSPWTKFPSPFQLIVQKIDSQGAQLTVPELAIAQCYVTFPPQHTVETMGTFLQQQVSAFAARHGHAVVPQIKWNGFTTESVQSTTEELERVLQGSAARLGLPPIDVGPSTGTSDMRHFCRRGIPCLLYGPGNGYNPHRPDEHYYLADLPRIILFYLDLVHAWCGESSSKGS